ncbi:hypothetical protein CALVIDRAFT_541054 [Calocera viscosa TUFC12733]|uniref:Uncharacterized protein n=1 Tax=Calocera viscosa (strain TUFC12733) TaxID=1330018 RepID=A0A167I2Y7_CALVF|nr:hypothetical protein CALVIDRAFT_541054 [Calocera viscosa TUFC12733]
MSSIPELLVQRRQPSALTLNVDRYPNHTQILVVWERNASGKVRLDHISPGYSERAFLDELGRRELKEIHTVREWAAYKSGQKMAYFYAVLVPATSRGSLREKFRIWSDMKPLEEADYAKHANGSLGIQLEEDIFADTGSSNGSRPKNTEPTAQLALDFVELRRHPPALEMADVRDETRYIVVFERDGCDEVIEEHNTPKQSADMLRAELRKKRGPLLASDIIRVQEWAAYMRRDEVAYFYMVSILDAAVERFEQAIRDSERLELFEDSKYVRRPDGTILMDTRGQEDLPLWAGVPISRQEIHSTPRVTFRDLSGTSSTNGTSTTLADLLVQPASGRERSATPQLPTTLVLADGRSADVSGGQRRSGVSGRGRSPSPSLLGQASTSTLVGDNLPPWAKEAASLIRKADMEQPGPREPSPGMPSKKRVRSPEATADKASTPVSADLATIWDRLPSGNGPPAIQESRSTGLSHHGSTAAARRIPVFHPYREAKRKAPSNIVHSRALVPYNSTSPEPTEPVFPAAAFSLGPFGGRNGIWDARPSERLAHATLPLLETDENKSSAREQPKHADNFDRQQSPLGLAAARPGFTHAPSPLPLRRSNAVDRAQTVTSPSIPPGLSNHTQSSQRLPLSPPPSATSALSAHALSFSPSPSTNSDDQAISPNGERMPWNGPDHARFASVGQGILRIPPQAQEPLGSQLSTTGQTSGQPSATHHTPMPMSSMHAPVTGMGALQATRPGGWTMQNMAVHLQKQNASLQGPQFQNVPQNQSTGFPIMPGGTSNWMMVPDTQFQVGNNPPTNTGSMAIPFNASLHMGLNAAGAQPYHAVVPHWPVAPPPQYFPAVQLPKTSFPPPPDLRTIAPSYGLAPGWRYADPPTMIHIPVAPAGAFHMPVPAAPILKHAVPPGLSPPQPNEGNSAMIPRQQSPTKVGSVGGSPSQNVAPSQVAGAEASASSPVPSPMSTDARTTLPTPPTTVVLPASGLSQSMNSPAGKSTEKSVVVTDILEVGTARPADGPSTSPVPLQVEAAGTEAFEIGIGQTTLTSSLGLGIKRPEVSPPEATPTIASPASVAGIGSVEPKSNLPLHTFRDEGVQTEAETPKFRRRRHSFSSLASIMPVVEKWRTRVHIAPLSTGELDTLLITAVDVPHPRKAHRLEDLDKAASALKLRAKNGLRRSQSVSVRVTVDLLGLVEALKQPPALVEHLTSSLVARFLTHVLNILEIGPLADVRCAPIQMDPNSSEDRWICESILLADRKEYPNLYQDLQHHLPSYLTLQGPAVPDVQGS